MARTKASVGARFASGKSSKAVKSSSSTPAFNSSSSSGSSEKSSRGSTGGGNPVCPRETPAWQKPITRFLMGTPRCNSDADNDAGPSNRSTKPKANIDEVQQESETQDNDIDITQNSDLSDENDDSEAKKQRPRKKNIIQSDDEDEIAVKSDQSKHQSDKEEGKDQSEGKNQEHETTQSDEESEIPKNQVLEESIILEPLTGDNSHKIDEYYSYKNKGKGKKSNANKENIASESNNSKKRCLDENDDSEHVIKRVKVAPIV